MALKCEQCGKEFKNDLALKIHIGRKHAGKAKAATKKVATQKVAPAGETTCKICGRTFAMPLHLGRHMSATHAKAKAAAPAKRGRRKAAAAPRTPAARGTASAGLSASVRELTIDQLIGLKEAVDARLAEIVRFMRQAKVSV
jgi:hypothetical protein